MSGRPLSAQGTAPNRLGMDRSPASILATPSPNSLKVILSIIKWLAFTSRTTPFFCSGKDRHVGKEVRTGAECQTIFVWPVSAMIHPMP